MKMTIGDVRFFGSWPYVARNTKAVQKDPLAFKELNDRKLSARVVRVASIFKNLGLIKLEHIILLGM